MAVRKTDLFGGAITVNLPSEFSDVSAFRQVPDSQEVYLSQTGLGSIIFEITERVQPPDHPCSTDDEAFLYHYRDLVAAGYGREKPDEEVKEESKIWRQSHIKFKEMPDLHAFSLFGSQTPQVKLDTEVERKPQPDLTGIFFTMLRLEKQQSDILISVNVPHVPGEYAPSQIALERGQLGPFLTEAESHMHEVLASFKIIDWDLFGTD